MWGNEGSGRMHRLDKMDTKANCQKGKSLNLERCGLGCGSGRWREGGVGKIMICIGDDLRWW